MGHVPPFRNMKKMRDERVSKKQHQSDLWRTTWKEGVGGQSWEAENSPGRAGERDPFICRWRLVGSLDPGKAHLLGPSVGKPSNTLVSQRVESDYS